MSDILVQKYQHYLNESIKLQETVNEQAAYIQELEEALIALSDEDNIAEAFGQRRVMTSKGIQRRRKFSTRESRRKEAEWKSEDPNKRWDESAGLVPVSPEHQAAYDAVRAHKGINSDQLYADMSTLRGHEFARKHAIIDAKRRGLDRVVGLVGIKQREEEEMAKRKNPTFTRDLENYIGPKTPHKFRKPLPITMIKNKYKPLTRTKNLKPLNPGNVLDISKPSSELFKNINNKK